MMRIRLVAIGIAIALLLPLVVVAGVETFSPPPDYQKMYLQRSEREAKATSAVEKKQIAIENAQSDAQLAEQEKTHEKRLFYASYLIGLIAVIAGAMGAVHAVRSGLLFGGIILLAGGCYPYWDQMTAIHRFILTVIAFSLFIAIGWYQSHESQVVSREPQAG